MKKIYFSHFAKLLRKYEKDYSDQNTTDFINVLLDSYVDRNDPLNKEGLELLDSIIKKLGNQLSLSWYLKENSELKIDRKLYALIAFFLIKTDPLLITSTLDIGKEAIEFAKKQGIVPYNPLTLTYRDLENCITKVNGKSSYGVREGILQCSGLIETAGLNVDKIFNVMVSNIYIFFPENDQVGYRPLKDFILLCLERRISNVDLLMHLDKPGSTNMDDDLLGLVRSGIECNYSALLEKSKTATQHTPSYALNAIAYGCNVDFSGYVAAIKRGDCSLFTNRNEFFSFVLPALIAYYPNIEELTWLDKKYKSWIDFKSKLTEN